MRKTVHSSVICILLTLSMLVLGIYCADIHGDSSFSRASYETCTASLQAADNLADTHIYYAKNSMRLMEEFVLARQSARGCTVVRLSQCLLAALFMAGVYLLYLSFRNSALCVVGHDNQYGSRTLDYIHHIDGKKSHILFLI